MPREQRRELVIRQRVEQSGQSFASPCIDVSEDLLTGRGTVDHDHAAVRLVVAANDEPAIFHPADDPGRARDGYVEKLRETAHRRGSGVFEDHQHVEVDQADGAPMPMAEGPRPLSRVPRRQLAYDLGDKMPFVATPRLREDACD